MKTLLEILGSELLEISAASNYIFASCRSLILTSRFGLARVCKRWHLTVLLWIYYDILRSVITHRYRPLAYFIATSSNAKFWIKINPHSFVARVISPSKRLIKFSVHFVTDVLYFDTDVLTFFRKMYKCAGDGERRYTGRGCDGQLDVRSQFGTKIRQVWKFFIHHWATWVLYQCERSWVFTIGRENLIWCLCLYGFFALEDGQGQLLNFSGCNNI